MLKLFFALFMVVLLSGCFEGERSGPEKVHWDRDIGELCKMMISDPKFVAEIRGGPKRKLYKFDDIGCAINWLNDKPWAAEEETEIWVAERTSSRENVNWLNAREARYLGGAMSPMNYNYEAINASQPGSIDFIELTTIILADAPNHICAVPKEDRP